jgi:hypothetical protein
MSFAERVEARRERREQAERTAAPAPPPVVTIDDDNEPMAPADDDDDAPMPSPVPVHEDDAERAQQQRRRKRAAEVAERREEEKEPALECVPITKAKKEPRAKAPKARAPSPPVVTLDDDDDGGVAPAPPTSEASDIAAWAALEPPGARAAWEGAGFDFDDQLETVISGREDFDVQLALAKAKKCEATARGLRYFVAVATNAPPAADVRITDDVRRALPGVDADYARAKSGALSLMDHLTKLGPERARLAGSMRILDAARGRGDVRATLCGVGAPKCLLKENVVATGVFEFLGSDSRGDTRRDVIEICSLLGATLQADVTQKTTLLIVGLGEKGIGGHRDGKGAAPETSDKYRKASTINSKRTEKRRSENQKRLDRDKAMETNARLKKAYEPAAVPADIKILYEDKFYEFLRSLPAQDDAPAVSTAPATRTAAPLLPPDLGAVRFTHKTRAAHGKGEPGREGSMLADALAPPAGYTFDNGLIVSGEHLDKGFAHSLLQTCACADGADDGRERDLSYIALHWEGEVTGLVPGDVPQKKAVSDPGGWLGSVVAKPGWCTRPTRGDRPGRPFEACREIHVPAAHRVACDRRKPVLGAQFGLLADQLIGKGQCHSKFFLLRFRRFVPGEGPKFLVRLVVSSGNVRPCAYAALPMRRECVGLWWADFPEVKDPAPSPFRDTLLRHTAALVSARTPTTADFALGLAREVTKDGATKTKRLGRTHALRRYAHLVKACTRANFALADAATVRLVASEPGLHSRATNVAADALRVAFAEACVEGGGKPLNCSSVFHSCNGFLAGYGPQRLERLKNDLTPGGGKFHVFWPECGDEQLLKDRAKEDIGRKHASHDRGLEGLKTVCDGGALTRLRVPHSAGQRGADKFVWTPHLMLYVLHDDAGCIKRLLLSSANFSAAAWGYRRSGRFPDDENAAPTDDGALEVRSFELGVCVPPGDPDRAKGGLPFVFPAAAAGQCQKAFIGITSLDQNDRGTLFY